MAKQSRSRGLKTNFKPIGNVDVTPMVDIREKNKPFEGYYLRSKVIESPKLKKGRGTVHEFMTRDGELVGIWGAGQLDYRLKAVNEEAPNAMTRITWLGKGTFKNKKGQKTAVHNFEVLVDADDVTTARV